MARFAILKTLVVVRGDNLLGGEFFAAEETEEEFHSALGVVSVPVSVV